MKIIERVFFLGFLLAMTFSCSVGKDNVSQTSSSSSSSSSAPLAPTQISQVDNGSEHIVTLSIRSNAYVDNTSGSFFQIEAGFSFVISNLNPGDTIKFNINFLNPIEINRTDLNGLYIYYGGYSASVYTEKDITNETITNTGTVQLISNTSAMRIDSSTSALDGFICRLKNSSGTAVKGNTLESITHTITIPNTVPSGNAVFTYINLGSINFSADFSTGDPVILFHSEN